MHRSGTTPRLRWLGIALRGLLLGALLLRGLLLGALLLSTTFGLPGSGPVALADDIADKQAEAAKVAGDLEAQGERVSILAEKLNQAQIAADKLA